MKNRYETLERSSIFARILLLELRDGVTVTVRRAQRRGETYQLLWWHCSEWWCQCRYFLLSLHLDNYDSFHITANTNQPLSNLCSMNELGSVSSWRWQTALNQPLLHRNSKLVSEVIQPWHLMIGLWSVNSSRHWFATRSSLLHYCLDDIRKQRCLPSTSTTSYWDKPYCWVNQRRKLQATNEWHFVWRSWLECLVCGAVVAVTCVVQ